MGRYCGTWHHNTWLQFNPQASGILNGHAILQRADGFTWQVCKKSDYVFVKSGTCEENGHHFIKTKAECEAAGTSLGVVHKPLTADGNRQRYCGTWHHNTWLQFNPQASGILNGHAILQRADGFTWQVCRKSDYAFVKSGTCEENGSPTSSQMGVVPSSCRSMLVFSKIFARSTSKSVMEVHIRFHSCWMLKNMSLMSRPPQQ